GSGARPHSSTSPVIVQPAARKAICWGGDDTDRAAFRRARASGTPGGAAELRRHQRDLLSLGAASTRVRARGLAVAARPLGGGSSADRAFPAPLARARLGRSRRGPQTRDGPP